MTTPEPSSSAPVLAEVQSTDSTHNGINDYLPICQLRELSAALDRSRPSTSGNRLSYKRKRASSENEYSDSSDPPLFSSDDLQPGAEDYSLKRQRRLHPGTWWAASQHPIEAMSLPPSRRTFSRNFDSGVFMGSDSSCAESDDIADLLHMPQPALNLRRTGVRAIAAKPKTTDNDHLQQAQRSAQRLVQRCVDDCNCMVDLTSLGLERIESETLRPLRYMLRFKNDQPFQPQTQLYLARNDLRSLPDGLYNLGSITNLSIRCNKIRHIQPQIARLVNLMQLNISVNELRYLPFSILKIFSRDLHRTESVQEFFTMHYHLRPNPFNEPVSRVPGCGKRPACRPAGHLQVKAISTVSYLSMYGSPFRADQPCPSRQASNRRPAAMTKAKPEEESSVPSLFELCLRGARLSNKVPAMLSELDDAKAQGVNLPAVTKGLEQVSQIQDAGPIQCDVCGREYIVARAEWLEWWSGVRDNEECLIPLLRKTCSWKCAGEAERKATGLDDEWRQCGWRQPG